MDAFLHLAQHALRDPFGSCFEQGPLEWKVAMRAVSKGTRSLVQQDMELCRHMAHVTVRNSCFALLPVTVQALVMIHETQGLVLDQPCAVQERPRAVQQLQQQLYVEQV